MKRIPSSADFASLAFAGALLGSTFFAAPNHASAQTGYTTNFNSVPPFANGQTLSDNGGWVTNDEDTGQTYNGEGIGQSDDTQTANGYTVGTTDLAALLGGAFNTGNSSGTYPGQSTVYVTHPANLPVTGSAEFDTDYVVSVPGTTHTGHDAFGFVFGNTTTLAGVSTVTPLFSVNFVQTSMDSSTLDNISITSATGTSAALVSFTLGKRYKLTVGVNLTLHTFTVGVTPETNTGTISGAETLLPGTFAYTGTLTDFGANWVLANTTANPLTSSPGNGGTPGGTAYTSGGDNTLLFDNIGITVPEPSTYAMLGIGLALGVCVMKRRSQVA